MLKNQAMEIKKLARRTSEAEGRIGTQEDGLDHAVARIQTLEKEVLTLAQQIDDTKNRGRRKNVCVLSLKLGIETGTGALNFFEEGAARISAYQDQKWPDQASKGAPHADSKTGTYSATKTSAG